MIPSIEVKGAVTKLRFDVSTGWEQWLWLTSDNHFDAVNCNRKTLKSHLDEAKARNALIFVFGDWFDAMQGRFDPRRSMSEVRPEYRADNYYDLIVDDSEKFLAPYAENIILITDGNHETAVEKNASINLTDRLVKGLRSKGSQVQRGGYGGWVKLLFDMSGGKRAGPRKSINIKYHHGSGGNAPVTKGVIQTNRQAVYLPDADIVVNGHNHQAYDVPLVRERISDLGVQYFDLVHYIRTSGYKQDYGDGGRGWAVEKGFAPSPIGGCWVHITCQIPKIKIQCIQEIEPPEI